MLKRHVAGLAVMVLCAGAQTVVKPGSFAKIGKVDERYQSFNIEMVEVTGGRFWKPYADVAKAPAEPSNTNRPAGIDPSLFEYRKPIDLSNAKLRKLAAALGPSYVRVSGTWANTSFFQDSDEAAPATAPKGFNGVLTRGQWKGVVDFSKAVDAKIVTSFATSGGTRDANGVWTSDEAAKFLAYTKSIGGHIAAAEFMNEPTFAQMGGGPKGYDGASYGKDLAVFMPWVKQAAPDMLILGPGSVGEGISLGGGTAMQILKSEDLLTGEGKNVPDAFSYHFYGAVSKRCGAAGMSSTTSPEAALTADWLDRTITVEQFYAGLRDRFVAGKPMWLTETAEAACGGDVWASTFIDSFRYLDQLGRLAKAGVQVVAHNTLAASDYGLLDEKTYEPRPNYWSAWMWRKFMDATVLDAGAGPAPTVHVYAHCMNGKRGGVSMLVINTDKSANAEMDLAGKAERYTMTAQDLLGKQVELNGAELKLTANDEIPQIKSVAAKGKVSLPSASITFLAIPDAHNASCR